MTSADKSTDEPGPSDPPQAMMLPQVDSQVPGRVGRTGRSSVPDIALTGVEIVPSAAELDEVPPRNRRERRDRARLARRRTS